MYWLVGTDIDYIIKIFIKLFYNQYEPVKRLSSTIQLPESNKASQAILPPPGGITITSPGTKYWAFTFTFSIKNKNI